MEKFSHARGLGGAEARTDSVVSGIGAAVDMLLVLNVARAPRDLGPLRSVALHRLKGDRRGQWAMTVNERWRICFVFTDYDASDAESVDYHRG